MGEFVKVKVIARQKVSYSQVLTMRREDWEELKLAPYRQASGEITDRLDLRDVQDADTIDDDFEAFVVDNDGKPVKPVDEYTDT